MFKFLKHKSKVAIQNGVSFFKKVGKNVNHCSMSLEGKRNRLERVVLGFHYYN